MKVLSGTLLLGLCVGLAPSLHATVSFSSGGSGCGSSFCASGGGVSVVATGLSATFTNGNTGTPTVGSNLTTSGTSITQYAGYGLGVCDPSDPNCSAPEHAIDNNGGRVDFVLLQLSVPMSSISLTLSPFNSKQDMDITVISGLCTNLGSPNNCTPAGMLASLGLGSTVAPTATALNALFGTGTSNVSQTNYDLSGTAGQSTNLTVNLTGTVGQVNWILVGATTQPYYGDGSCGYQNNNIGIGLSCSPDYFKLNALNGASVPEPATFGMAGAALAALGLLRRRKRLSAKS